MFNLPQEIIDLIFEFRDGNKKDNFDKVLYEFQKLKKENWETYCWYGNCNLNEEIDEKFLWMTRISYVEFEPTYLNGVSNVERKLNLKMKDTILDHYIEKYDYNLDDATYKKWNKKYNRNYIFY